MKSEIRDINLWESGARKIQWVKNNMPLLRSIEEEFVQTKPFTGLKVALSVHLEAKTAYLCKVFAAGGAEMYVTGSNPLSTQDDVAAALVHDGLNVFAWYDSTEEEYHRHISSVIKAEPNIIIDDGGDLVHLIHTEYPHLIDNVLGGCEETTTGIHRLKAMNNAGKLKFPMVFVNDADCKHLFDNRYGTGQSVWDGINRTTNLIVAGKNVVVAAMRAKGLGASVIVTEIDPIKAMEAVMDGFKVMKMTEAAKIGDFFITVTGCNQVICEDSFKVMKDGVICCNAGHFDVEVDVACLKKIAKESHLARNNIMCYTLEDGRRINVIAEGRLVNLAAGDGHPAEIMDMSFAIQLLSALYIVKHKGKLDSMVINVPKEIDNEVAERKLKFWGIEIDRLTKEQQDYMNSTD